MNRSAAIILVGAALCAASDGDWPTFRGNLERTGTVVRTTGFPARDSAWSALLGGPIVSSPSVVGELLYVGCRDSCVYAVNTNDGTLAWKRRTGGWVDASPHVTGGRVYAASRDGNIYVLDAGNGDSIGALHAGLQISSPAVTDDGWLLSGIGPPDNGFTAYSLKNPTGSWTIYFPQYCYSSPAVSGSLVAIGAGDGNLYGISMVLKRESWRFETRGGVYLATPAIRDGRVYFAPGDDDRNVYAIGLSDGAPLWASTGVVVGAKQRSPQTEPIDGALVAALRRLSPHDRNQTILALKKQGVAAARRLTLAKSRSGSEPEFLPIAGGVQTSSVAVDESHVFVVQKEQGHLSDVNLTPASRFTLFALSAANGAELWRYSEVTASVELGYCSSPIVAGRNVIAGWGGGHVCFFDTSDGEVQWSDTVHGAILSSPCIAAGRLFVATMDGRVYGYRLSGTAKGTTFQQSTYCYPNPSRGPLSHIQVFVNKAAKLTMTLYNTADKPVLRVHRDMPAGEKYVYEWDLGRVANGVYFARIKVEYAGGGEEKKTVKIAVLK